MKSLILICLLFIVAPTRAADEAPALVDWSGEWKFKPNPKTETCCYPAQDIKFTKNEAKLHISFGWRETTKPCQNFQAAGFSKDVEPATTMDLESHLNLHFTLKQVNDKLISFESKQGEETCVGEIHRNEPLPFQGNDFWELKPESTSDKCCYFDPATIIDCTKADKCVITARFSDTSACRHLTDDKNFNTEVNKDKIVDFYIENWKVTMEFKDANTIKYLAKREADECPATMTLHPNLISLPGAYKFTPNKEDKEYSGCCPKETLIIKNYPNDDDHHTIKGEWEDNEKCKQIDLKGSLSAKVDSYEKNAITESFQVTWYSNPNDPKTNSLIDASFRVKKWKSVIDVFVGLGNWGNCKGTAVEIEMPTQTEGQTNQANQVNQANQANQAGEQAPSASDQGAASGSGGPNNQAPGKKDDEGGFPWWIVITLAIIAVLAVVGYFVYNKNRANKLQASLLQSDADHGNHVKF